MNDWIIVSILPQIPRRKDGSRLISDWVDVKTCMDVEYRSYYHVWHGWMIKSEIIVDDFKYGYISLSEKVTHWKLLK